MKSSKMVLAMDDSEIILASIKVVLGNAGYNVVTANNVAQLDERFTKSETPDLVVLDVQMPEAFGDDIGNVLRRVRKLAVPILLFSSIDDAALAARAKAAGLDGWVSKNAGLEALRTRVDSMLATAPRKKILIVDDSPIVLEVAATVLGARGYDVVTLRSPFELASAMRTEHPDLVLIDVSMPALQGNKVVEVMRRGMGESARLVLHSDRDETELKRLVKECGASGYIQKGSNPTAFVASVEAWL